MFIPALLLGGLILMAGGGGKKRRRPTPTPNGEEPDEAIVREPTAEEAEALTFCEMEGGTGLAMETPEGVTYFVCSWPDGRMVEAGAYFRGEAVPECPVNMLYDTEAGTCVPAPEDVDDNGCPAGFQWDEAAGNCVSIGEAWPPHPDDPNFQICMGSLLGAWAPWTDVHYNLSPAVAENAYLIMRNAVEEGWGGYTTVESLADLGMVHVAPQCDWVALRNYVIAYKEQVGMPPGNPDDVEAADAVYVSVLLLAERAVADADIPAGGFDQEGDPGLNAVPTGDVFPECPPNYFYDALHDVCCPDGFFWDVEDQMCRPFDMGYGGIRGDAGNLAGYGGLPSGYGGAGGKPAPGSKPKPLPEACPSGWYYDFGLGHCVKWGSYPGIRCPDGTQWDPQALVCQPGKVPPKPMIPQAGKLPTPSIPQAGTIYAPMEIASVTIYAENVGKNISPTGWSYTLHVFGKNMGGVHWAIINQIEAEVLHASPTKVVLGTNYKPHHMLDVISGEGQTEKHAGYKIEWAKWIYPKRGPTKVAAKPRPTHARPGAWRGKAKIKSKKKKPQLSTKAHRVDSIRMGFAGGCGGRRGHCGVRPR